MEKIDVSLSPFVAFGKRLYYTIFRFFKIEGNTPSLPIELGGRYGNRASFCLFHLLRVEFEEVGDDFRLGRVGREAVGGQHSAVVRLVRGAEVGWHRERVVEIGKR